MQKGAKKTYPFGCKEHRSFPRNAGWHRELRVRALSLLYPLRNNIQKIDFFPISISICVWLCLAAFICAYFSGWSGLGSAFTEGASGACWAATLKARD